MHGPCWCVVCLACALLLCACATHACRRPSSMTRRCGRHWWQASSTPPPLPAAARAVAVAVAGTSGCSSCSVCSGMWAARTLVHTSTRCTATAWHSHTQCSRCGRIHTLPLTAAPALAGPQAAPQAWKPAWSIGKRGWLAGRPPLHMKYLRPRSRYTYIIPNRYTYMLLALRTTAVGWMLRPTCHKCLHGLGCQYSTRGLRL